MTHNHPINIETQHAVSAFQVSRNGIRGSFINFSAEWHIFQLSVAFNTEIYDNMFFYNYNMELCVNKRDQLFGKCLGKNSQVHPGF